MKKIMLLLLFIPLVGFSQISTTKPVIINTEKKTIVYDSLTNFVENNVECLINQNLYLRGTSITSQKYGYKDFFSDYKNDVDIEKSYKDKVYKCCDGFNSKYDTLVGKNFKIIEVIKHPKAENDYTGLYEKCYYLKLLRKDNNDVLYYKYNHKYDFPFIIEGFYVKTKKLIVGNSYVFADFINQNIKQKHDINNGKLITPLLGESWKCLDLTIDESNYYLSLILTNNKQTFFLDYENEFIDSEKYNHMFSLKNSEKYKLKFGTANWNMILMGKIKIGMTKEMCRISWGKPDDINETIIAGYKTEQWVYPNNYIYFEKGILKTIQSL